MLTQQRKERERTSDRTIFHPLSTRKMQPLARPQDAPSRHRCWEFSPFRLHHHHHHLTLSRTAPALLLLFLPCACMLAHAACSGGFPGSHVLVLPSGGPVHAACNPGPAPAGLFRLAAPRRHLCQLRLRPAGQRGREGIGAEGLDISGYRYSFVNYDCDPQLGRGGEGRR